MARVQSYRVPPIRHQSLSEWVRQTAQAVRLIMNGKINSTGSVTLTGSSATSTLTDILIGNDTVILFMPKTANAAAEMDGMYVSARTSGSATLTHANNSQADRTFDYILIG